MGKGWPIVAPGERVSFSRFMELALYDPEHGYYARRHRHYPAGPGGDFVTAPTAHPAFAATFARVLMALKGKRGVPFEFADLGAGDGRFLRHLTGALPEGVVARFCAVEVSPAGREVVALTLPQVACAESLSELPPPAGPCVVFASELYDALPCHVVEGREGGIVELYVEVAPEGSLRFVTGPPSTPELEAYLARHGIALEPGQRAELRPQAKGFHEAVLAWAGDDAVVFVLDYGYRAKALYNPKARRGGSLVGYRDHQPVRDVLKNPGEVDITAHVNWDDLLAAGARLGFAARGVEPLGLFLTRWGILGEAGQGFTVPWEVKALVNPAGMGTDLKVLVQGKGGLWDCWQAVDDARRP
ncbi:MAG: SAM-dependent methyltransferase [Thermoanaerobaculum sp.]